jgi:cytidine deaminase
MLTESEINDLVAAAEEAREQAYVPYSGFAVGAAVRAEDGSISTGCNVENASYGLTICAERNAVFQGVARGARRFTAVAVVTANGVSPCGACRQVLAEFGADMLVIIAGEAGTQHRYRLDELLPAAFLPAQLPEPPRPT